MCAICGYVRTSARISRLRRWNVNFIGKGYIIIEDGKLIQLNKEYDIVQEEFNLASQNRYIHPISAGDIFIISIDCFENVPEEISIKAPKLVTIGDNNNLVFSEDINNEFELTAFCFLDYSLITCETKCDLPESICIALMQTQVNEDKINFNDNILDATETMRTNGRAVVTKINKTRWNQCFIGKE